MSFFAPVKQLCLAIGFALALCSSVANAAPTEAQMALARQIVNGSGLTRSFEGTVPQILAQINSSIIRTRPEVGADLKIVVTALEAEFAPQTKTMVDKAAVIFASKFTDAEMKDIATFFASASGKKYVESQPVAVDEIVNSMDDWRKELGASLSDRLRTEMKKKGHSL